MTKLTICLFNNKDMRVHLKLSINKLRLLELVFDAKTDYEKKQFFQQRMESDYWDIYEESFEALKEDFENYLDEILDVSAGGACSRELFAGTRSYEHFEQVNSLLTTGQFLGHYNFKIEGDVK